MPFTVSVSAPSTKLPTGALPALCTTLTVCASARSTSLNRIVPAAAAAITLSSASAADCGAERITTGSLVPATEMVSVAVEVAPAASRTV